MISPTQWKDELTNTQLSNDQTISIATFNTLRKDYDFQEKYWVTQEMRHWDFRLSLHKKLLAELNTDIICLQEAEIDSVVTEFAFVEELGYTLIPGVAKNAKDNHYHTKPSLLYKKDKLKLKFVNNRTRTVVYKFEDLNKNEFCLINCHLQGGTDESQQCFQMKSALATLQTESKNNPDIPAFVCGDFNSDSDRSVHQLIKNGTISPEDNQKFFKNTFKFKNVFKFQDSLKDVSPRPFTHKWGVKEDAIFNSIDFVYYTPAFFEVCKIRDPLTETQKIDMKETGGLPNDWVPSDHLPLAVLFKFKTPDLST